MSSARRQERIPAPDAACTGNRIAELRSSKNWSQQDLADAVGAHWTTISKLETGKIKLTTQWMDKFATALGVQTAEILALYLPPNADDPASRLMVCGYCGTWQSKPCGDGCRWGITVRPDGSFAFDAPGIFQPDSMPALRPESLDPEAVRKWIDETSGAMGITLTAWARLAGLAPSTINRFLGGKGPSNLSANTISALANAASSKLHGAAR